VKEIQEYPTFYEKQWKSRASVYTYVCTLQFCSRDAVTWLKANSVFFFFSVPKTLCRCWRQQRSRRSVEDCQRKRSCNKERQIASLSLSYYLPALGALRDKFKQVRFFFESLRYVRLATSVPVEKFSWRSDT